MIYFLAGAFGVLAALAAHDLAAQALGEQALGPFKGTCPRCHTHRGWTHNVCPDCGRRVSREWVFVVAGVAGAIAFTNTVEATWVLPAYLAFLLLSLALVATDIDALRIVDRLNLRGTVVLAGLLAAGAGFESSWDAYWRALLGALAYFVGTNIMFFLVRGRGFGYGDVKLSVQLGLFTAYISWGTLGWAVFLMAMIGGLLSIGVLILGFVQRRRHIRANPGDDAPSMRDVMKAELPYGPSMIAGAWIAIALAGLGAFPIPA